jgi:phosphatidylglycerol:prolipoprotein diacylglycerol transferase
MVHPNINPVAFEIFGFGVHWYGLMYLLGFASAYALGHWRARKPGALFSPKQIEDLIFWGAVGLVFGGRCGYVFFYNMADFLADPLWLFRIWEGGMSFHGGVLGVLLAMLLFARKEHKNFLDIMDFVTPLVPPGLFFGRMGNFIGQELWGRETTVPWAMKFPKDHPDMLLRHPSQLYEAFLEGLVLFIILLWYSSKPRPRGTVVGLGALLYGVFRFSVEFVREPDAHLQSELWFGWMTRGQQLCIPMIVVGLLMILVAYRGTNNKSVK